MHTDPLRNVFQKDGREYHCTEDNMDYIIHEIKRNMR